MKGSISYKKTTEQQEKKLLEDSNGKSFQMPPTGNAPIRQVVQLSGNDTLTVFIHSRNGTFLQMEGTEQEEYDGNGAMRFIIATLLVYSLIGIVGVMLLKIRKSTSKSQRVQAAKEESVQKYLKHCDKLRLQGYRDALKIETSRTLHRILSMPLTSLESKVQASTQELEDGTTNTVSDNETESALLTHSPLVLEDFTSSTSLSTGPTSPSVDVEVMSGACDIEVEDKEHS